MGQIQTDLTAVLGQHDNVASQQNRLEGRFQMELSKLTNQHSRFATQVQGDLAAVQDQQSSLTTQVQGDMAAVRHEQNSLAKHFDRNLTTAMQGIVFPEIIEKNIA